MRQCPTPAVIQSIKVMTAAFIPATFRSTQPRAAERNKGSLLPLQPPLSHCEVFASQRAPAREPSHLDQRHQGRSSTKVMVGKTSFLSTFMSVHICAEVRHILGKGISCPVLYPDPASAGSDKEDEQTAKNQPFPPRPTTSPAQVLAPPSF